MNTLQLPKIQAVSLEIENKIQACLDGKTKPLGALGRIEEIATQIARIQSSINPAMKTCRLFLFAGDHGVAASGVSAYPKEVTRQMVLNFLDGGAAANVFAVVNDVSVTVVDAGVAGEPIVHNRLASRRIGPGTQNYIEQPAMSKAELNLALHNGIELGSEIDSDAVAFGEMGIGNTSSAALLTHKLSGHSLIDIVGRGTGLDDLGLKKKQDLLKLASDRTANKLTPNRALQEYGGFEVATMVGAILGAASAKRLVLVDGYIATAAALVAVKMKPEARAYCLFSHESAEKGHKLMLDLLGARGLLDLELRLGEGSGALLAWPLVKCAAEMMTRMASFSSAEVSDGSSH